MLVLSLGRYCPGDHNLVMVGLDLRDAFPGDGEHPMASASSPGKEVEGAVLRNITGLILTNRNLEELVRLTNEELAASSQEIRRHLSILEHERRQVDSRLERLYDALETGKVEPDDLAPRIKDLRLRHDELLRAEMQARTALDGSYPTR